MQDLCRFIHDKTTSGHDYEEISLMLKKKGHQDLEIRKGLQKYNYCRNLSVYIGNQMNLGSSYAQVKLALQNQGYNPDDIDFARSLLAHKTMNPVIAVGALAVFLISVVVLLIILFRPSVPSSLLDYELTPDSKTLDKDSVLRFNVKLVNFGKNGRFDVELEHTIISDSGKIIDYASETVAVETQTSKTVEMDIENIKPGKYRLSSIARYKGETASAGFTFTIMADENIPVEPVEKVQSKINDTVPVINHSRTESPPDDLLGTIIRELDESTSINQKESVCEQQDTLFADYCWDRLATDADNADYCANIADQENADFCYLTIALDTSDHGLCEKIDTPNYRATCQTI